MSDIEPGTYSVQAFLTRYETVTRSDGSKVGLRFPCGDGGLNVDGFGSLTTSMMDIDITGASQSIELVFNNITAVEAFTGKEIGGCNQGNYEATDYLKYVKIQSKKLSKFWGRDMYVGVNVVLPAGYDANDTKTRYPIIYNQGHWPADVGAYNYGSNPNFTAAWNAVTIPATNTTAARPAPKFILVTSRSVEDTADSVLFAMKGDIEGLKRLFSRGEAFPVDESSSRGFSLIRACASQPCRVFQRPKTLTILVGSLWWDATI